MFATFAALVGFFTTLNLADRLAAHVNAPRATEYPRESQWTAADSSDVADLRAIDGALPGDYGHRRGAPIDDTLFERAISDSARAADSARGEVPSERRRPCKVGGTWMLCPDRSSHLIAPPAAAIVQVARIEIAEPARETTCYSEISCPR